MKLLACFLGLTTTLATHPPTSSNTISSQVLSRDTPIITGTCVVGGTLTGYCHTTLYGDETCAQDSAYKTTGNT
ncbi:hypothetical protein BDZ45DRAFT_734367 [Acephala macrosclerotiorum]|nr:hypothetical protein BDZ45DRAFT_734367 [Acephala macrosclerotiorum]